MNLIQRHLFASLAGMCIGGVLLFVFVLLTGNAMRDIIGLLADGRLSLGMFLRMLALLVPYAVSFAMPLGILIGILILVGRLSANRELTALKASGVSLWSVGAPILLFALTASVLATWINAYFAPQARASYRDLLNDLVRSNPLSFVVPRAFIHDFPGYVLYVGAKDGEQMRSFWLWELDDELRAVRLLRAESGSFRYDIERDALLLTLQEGFTELRSERNPDDLTAISPTLSFESTTVMLPLDRILGRAHRPLKVSWMSLDLLRERRSALRNTLGSEALDPEVRAEVKEDLAEVQFQISRNFAMAFSIFSLALVAIPLGIKANRSETYVNAGLALVLALTYYFSIIVMGWMDRTPGAHAELLVWIPNLGCQALGLTLFVRAARH